MSHSSHTVVGAVAALHRHPVKSMRGESLARARVDVRGIEGDRAYAVIDVETGHVASAKHPRKWASLLACSATYESDDAAAGRAPAIALPDGSVIAGDDAAVDDTLSRLLGRRVRLLSTPPDAPTREANRAPADADGDDERILTEPMALAAPGTFLDHAPVHIVATGTLERLRALHTNGDFAVERFRPNIVVETDEPIETSWPGRTIVIGGVVLRVIDPTPRCVITTLAQGALPGDRGILRTIARHLSAPSATAAPGMMLDAVLGVYAVAVTGGEIGVGDVVRLKESAGG